MQGGQQQRLRAANRARSGRAAEDMGGAGQRLLPSSSSPSPPLPLASPVSLRLPLSGSLCGVCPPLCVSAGAGVAAGVARMWRAVERVRRSPVGDARQTSASSAPSHPPLTPPDAAAVREGRDHSNEGNGGGQREQRGQPPLAAADPSPRPLPCAVSRAGVDPPTAPPQTSSSTQPAPCKRR